MTMKSTARRLRTRKKRVFVTDLETPDLLELWRAKYAAVFAAEAKAKRNWGPVFKKKPEDVEAEIEARQVEWDAYVEAQLRDIATAQPI